TARTRSLHGRRPSRGAPAPRRSRRGDAMWRAAGRAPCGVQSSPATPRCCCWRAGAGRRSVRRGTSPTTHPRRPLAPGRLGTPAARWSRARPRSPRKAAGSHQNLSSPLPYRLGVLRVMAVRIEPQATTEAALAAEPIFGRPPDEAEEPAMGLVHLPSHRSERQTRLLLGHPGVEGIDAAVPGGVPRWRPALEDEREVRQRLLFPRLHV